MPFETADDGAYGVRKRWPAGAVVAEVTEDVGIATASINLNQEWRLRWLSVGPGEGEARSLYIKERRPDAYSPLVH